MDIFSLGCVIYELMTDGKVLFHLGDLLDYRQGKLDIAPALAKITDGQIRSLVMHMVAVDPVKRLSALEYLQQNRGKIFPDVFYGFLHKYMRAFVELPSLLPDEKILRLYTDMGRVKEAFEKDTDCGNRFVIIGSLVTACCRSLSTTMAKLTALKILLEVSARVLDEYVYRSFKPCICIDMTLLAGTKSTASFRLLMRSWVTTLLLFAFRLSELS